MRFDWHLLVSIGILAGCSLLGLASVDMNFFRWQSVWYGFGFAVIFSVSLIDWRWLASHRWFGQVFFWLTVVVLAATLIIPDPIRGVRGWISVGPFNFQPAELAKASLIVVYAAFFARRHLEASVWKNILNSFIYFFIPAFLVLLQPDLGSSLILFSIWAGFLLVSGLKLSRLISGALILTAIAIVSWFLLLAPYQKARIAGFLFPLNDPLGVGYNAIQSKIAIGSGGLFGKGFRQGSQVQLGFLPESHSDFLLAAFIEEWGFAGGLIVFSTFLTLVWRIIKIGIRTSGNYGKFICLGTLLVLGTQFFFNAGSNLGFSPVVGVTFPFFSYGGSSILTLSFLLGIIQNIARQSYF